MSFTSQLSSTAALDVRGAGHPVVFVHGLGGTLNVWEPQVRALEGKFQTIRYDIRGSGRNRARAPLSVDDWVSELHDLLDELHIETAHFVGHSLGTLIIQHFAARFPGRVDSLALLGVNRSPPEARRASVLERAKQVRQKGLGAIVDQLIESVPSPRTRECNAVAISAIREMICGQNAEEYAWTCEAMATSRRPDLSEVTGPLLLIAGADDTVSPVEISRGMASEYINAELLVLPDCGHWIPVEQPDLVCQRLKKFLSNT